MSVEARHYYHHHTKNPGYYDRYYINTYVPKRAHYRVQQQPRVMNYQPQIRVYYNRKYPYGRDGGPRQGYRGVVSPQGVKYYHYNSPRVYQPKRHYYRYRH